MTHHVLPAKNQLGKIASIWKIFKAMPLGIKLFTLLGVYSFGLSLSAQDHSYSVAYWGRIFPAPVNTLMVVGLAVVNVLQLYSYFSRHRWGWTLSMMNSALAFVMIIFSLGLPVTRSFSVPLDKIPSVFNVQMESQYQTDAAYVVVRFVYTVIFVITLLFLSLITLYMYRKKSYFNRV